MNKRAWMTLILVLTLIPLGGAVWARRTVPRGPAEAAGAARMAAPAAVTPEAPPPGRDADGSFVGVVLSGETVEVAARVDGRVESVDVRIGDHVAQGRRLAAIDRRALVRELTTLRAGADALAAETDRSGVGLEEADTRLAHRRSAAALPIPAVSGEDLASAQYREREAAAALRVAEARLAERRGQIAQTQQQLDDTDVRAPFDGVVAARYVDPGATVLRGASLVRLVSTGAPRVRFAVPEGAVDAVRPGTRVSVAVDGVLQSLEAEVEKVAPEVETASRMIFVEASFSRPLDEQAKSALVGRIAHVEREPPSIPPRSPE
jgi:RND family efflux transporter MFP subunit